MKTHLTEGQVDEIIDIFTSGACPLRAAEDLKIPRPHHRLMDLLSSVMNPKEYIKARKAVQALPPHLKGSTSSSSVNAVFSQLEGTSRRLDKIIHEFTVEELELLESETQELAIKIGLLKKGMKEVNEE